MSGDLHERELGEAALDFIMECLRDGSTLAQLAAELVPWKRGTVTTLLPPSVTSQEAQAFRTGGKLPEPPASTWMVRDGMVLKPVPTTLRELAARLRLFFSTTPSAFGLFENLMARPGDAYLKRLQSKLLVHGSEIYHLVTADMGIDQIVVTLREARSLPDLTGFIALVPSRAAGTFLEPAAQLTDPDIRLVASTVQTVVVGVYDGESYLMWKRTKQEWATRAGPI